MKFFLVLILLMSEEGIESSELALCSVLHSSLFRGTAAMHTVRMETVFILLFVHIYRHFT